MALTASQQLEIMGKANRLPQKLAASGTYYRGGLMVFNAAGFLAATGGGVPAGVLTGYGFEPGEETQIVPAGANPVAEIEVGLVWVPFAAAQSDVGSTFYIADDNTITKSAGDNTHGLICKGYKAGFVLLDFGNIVAV